MNDLEQMIRESLEARANDVEPTPRLWEEVQRRTSRRRALTGLYWAVGAAAVAVVGVTVVPGLLDGPTQPDVTIGDRTPSEDATQAPPPVGSGPVPTHVVVAGEQDIRLVSTSGETVGTLVDLGPESEALIGSVAVRPGSTPESPTVAMSVWSEGEWTIRWVPGDAGAPEAPQIVAVAASPGVELPMPPAPVWSPDGSRLAWVGHDGQRLELRYQDWGHVGPSDGTGSLGSADGLDQLQLEDWTGGVESGRILASTADLNLVAIELDGGRATSIAPFDAPVDGAGLDVAFAESPDVLYALSARGDGSGDAESHVYTLAWTADGQRGETALPDELSTKMPPDAWMTVAGDLVAVGHGGTTWFIRRDGQLLGTLGDVVAADPVPLRVEQAPPPAPSETDPTPTEAAAPAAGPLVVLEDDRIVVQEGASAERVLHEWEASDEWRPAGIAVRPGSTLDDLTLLVLYASEGTSQLGWIHSGASEVKPYEPLPDQYQPHPDRDGRSLETPAWSSDGRHLAWVDEVDGVFQLRTMGWEDGPGTGRPADDNATFELTARDVQDMVLDEWTWVDEANGLLRFRVDGPDGHQVADLAIERQPDGALALGSTEPLPAELLEEVQVLDVARTDSGRFQLLVAQGEVRLAWLGDAETESLDVPGGIDVERLVDSPPAAGPYLMPAGEGALLRTPTGEIWFVTRDGASQVGAGRDVAPVR